MRKFISIVALLVGLQSLQAQVLRKYSNEFLNIGAGARAIGMAGAVTASVEGVEAGYWNPAGLLHGDFTYDAALMHASWFASIANYDYLALAYQAKGSPYRVGLSLLRFAIDDIQNTLNLVDDQGQVDYNRITRFSASDYALIGHFATPVARIPGLFLGINSKLIYRNIGPFANAYGFGFDAGVHYRSGDWMFSALLKDVTTTFNFWTFNNELLRGSFEQTGNELPEENLEFTPPSLTLGVARYMKINDDFGILPEMNAVLSAGPFAGINVGTILTVNPAIGVEADYRKWIFLRLGAGRWQRTTTFAGGQQWMFSPSLGLGLAFGRLKVDYALSNLVSFESALLSHIFSLKFSMLNNNSR
ncbi:hypothetical protein [Thermaurantimonas aggregans]|uniref:putative type IX sorting system protein PorV2 n=1 Tax=Thermaurantimonas aggregans TaxID=2173829 RepID=UPI0023F21370|nr:hypothetical protein [Thermaurantimonas aggregans]MCX8148181.1 hypothetical protein [Thermaurantimonas aggregans]